MVLRACASAFDGSPPVASQCKYRATLRQRGMLAPAAQEAIARLVRSPSGKVEQFGAVVDDRHKLSSARCVAVRAPFETVGLALIPGRGAR